MELRGWQAEPGKKANRQPSVVGSPRQLERKKKRVLKPAKRGLRVECTVNVPLHGMAMSSSCSSRNSNSIVEGLNKEHGPPLALIGSRTKLMKHWADRIDHWLDPKMPIKGGRQA